jgi:hypothetical protein
LLQQSPKGNKEMTAINKDIPIQGIAYSYINHRGQERILMATFAKSKTLAKQRLRDYKHFHPEWKEHKLYEISINVKNEMEVAA